MRTLKKSLCLVLAVVMILGLGAFNISALTTKDYADSKNISHGEAVDVLGAIGVLEGDDDDGDGKIDYRPNDKLTRAQAAKIITAMMRVSTVSSIAPFADVGADVAWAKDYIAYCAEQRIIEGVDDENNLFNPQGELTGGAFAKMLLVAMGYDAQLEGMAGTTSWLINVAKLVRNNNLDRNIENFPYDEAITRDQAAQLALNVLVAPLVSYENKGGTTTVNGVTITTTPGGAKYMTTSDRNTQTISYALVNDGSARGTYIVEFAEKYQPKLVRDKDDSDKFGRPCTEWSLNRVKIGSYPSTDKLVASWNSKFKNNEAYKAIGSDEMRKLETYGNAWFTVYENGLISERGYEDYFKPWDLNNTKDFDKSGAGRIIEVYIDDESGNTLELDAVTVVVIDTWLGEVTSALNSKGEARISTYGAVGTDLNGPVITVKEEDIPNLGDFKNEDKVLVQISNPKDNDKRAVENIVLAEKLSDKYVNKYEAGDRTVEDIYGESKKYDPLMKSVTSDGVTYDVAFKCFWNSDVLTNYTQQKLKDFSYDLYLDQFGNVIGIETNDDAADYVFVTAIQGSNSNTYMSNSDTYKASLIYTDGTIETNKTVKLSKKDLASAKPYFESLKYTGYTLNPGETKDTFDGLSFTDAVGRAATGQDGRSWDGSGNKGTDGAIVNRWFTYTKNDSGEITLVDVVGYSDGKEDNKGQSAVTVDQDISSSHPLLNYYDGSATGRAVGNEKSVYIPVTVEDKDVNGGMISKVNGTPITGIRNTNISPFNFFALDSGKSFNNFALYSKNRDNTYPSTTNGTKTWNFNTYETSGSNDTHAVWNGTYNNRVGNNVFFVYDRNTNFVLYAVVVARTNARDVLYITSTGVVSSQYVNGVGYVDSYDAIVNGKKETINVDRDEVESKLSRGLYYYAAKDGYVTEANRITSSTKTDDAGQNNADTNKNFGFAFLEGISYNALTVQGNTIRMSANDYLYVNSNTKFFEADNPGGEGDYEEFSSAESAKSAAIGDAKARDAAISVYAECDRDTGVAKFVVFVVGTGSASGKEVSTEDIYVLTNDDIPTYYKKTNRSADSIIVLYSTKAKPNSRQIEEALQKKIGSDFVINGVVSDTNGDIIFTYSRLLGTVVYNYTLDADDIIEVEALSGSINSDHTSLPVIIPADKEARINSNRNIGNIANGDVYVLGKLYIDGYTTNFGKDVIVSTTGHYEITSGTANVTTGSARLFNDGTQTVAVTGGTLNVKNLFSNGRVTLSKGSIISATVIEIGSQGTMSVSEGAYLNAAKLTVDGTFTAPTNGTAHIDVTTIDGNNAQAAEDAKANNTGANAVTFTVTADPQTLIVSTDANYTGNNTYEVNSDTSVRFVVEYQPSDSSKLGAYVVNNDTTIITTAPANGKVVSSNNTFEISFDADNDVAGKTIAITVSTENEKYDNINVSLSSS